MWIVLIAANLACAPSTTPLTCGEGTVKIDGECVSADPDTAPDTSTPAEDEVCTDEADNDGDGFIDCDDQDCISHTACDEDGDGYSALAGDCDDQDAAVSPEGQDGLIADRDCDGQPASGTLSLAEYAFLGENPGDYAAYWVATAGDVDGDGLDDILMGAYDEDTGGPGAGAVYLVLGSSLDSSGERSLAEADYKFVGEDAGDWAGIMVESGDIDGDGRDDLLIGAYGDADHGPITGAVYVVLASSLGAELTIDLSDADYKLVGEDRNDFAGYAVASADVDGDGLDDILVGASGEDTGGANAGAAYVVLASSLDEASAIDLAEADYKFIGENPDSWAGYQLASAGDVDGDGREDIILGADDDDGGVEAHAAYLILASSLETLVSGSTNSLAVADTKFVGETVWDWASQISSAGDVDGDGLDDLIIGAAGRDDAGVQSGAAYVVLGSSLGAEPFFDLSNADYKLVGEQPGAWAGAVVSDAGDVDGDGLADVLVGAYYYDGDHSYQGAAYVVLGSQLGTDRELSLSEAAHRLAGAGEDDYAGQTVAGAGDVDGDGLGDIIVGGWRGPDWTGIGYLVTGG